MSEEQNVLEQLRNRKRASVPKRCDPLIPEIRVEDSDEQSLSSPSTLEDLQQKLAQ